MIQCHYSSFNIRALDYFSIDLGSLSYDGQRRGLECSMLSNQKIYGVAERYFKTFNDALAYLLSHWDRHIGPIKGIVRNDYGDIPRFYPISGMKLIPSRSHMWIFNEKEGGSEMGSGVDESGWREVAREMGSALRHKLLYYLGSEESPYKPDFDLFKKDILVIATHFSEQEHCIVPFEDLFKQMFKKVVEESLTEDQRFHLLSGILHADLNIGSDGYHLMTKGIIEAVLQSDGDEDFDDLRGKIMHRIFSYRGKFFDDSMEELITSAKFLNSKSAQKLSYGRRKRSNDIFNFEYHLDSALWLALRAGFKSNVCLKLVEAAPMMTAYANVASESHGQQSLPIHKFFSRDQLMSGLSGSRIRDSPEKVYNLFLALVRGYDKERCIGEKTRVKTFDFGPELEALKKEKTEEELRKWDTVGVSEVKGTGGADVTDKYDGYTVLHLLAEAPLPNDDYLALQLLEDVLNLYPDALTKKEPTWGQTPLGLALYRCENKVIVRKLLELERERDLSYVCTPNDAGDLPIMNLMRVEGKFDKEEILDILIGDYASFSEAKDIKYGCAIIDQSNGNYPLHDAIQAGFPYPIIKKIYDLYPDASWEANYEGVTPFEMNPKLIESSEQFTAAFKELFEKILVHRRKVREELLDLTAQIDDCEISEDFKMMPSPQSRDDA